MNNKGSELNREYLEECLIGTELADFPAEIIEYPERVVQFGEGNFLRAFVDWMFQQMNKKGVFKGRIVIVQPILDGRVSNLNKQDNLYTLLLRGTKNGELIEKKEIITSVSRSLNAYTQWTEVLKLAENPEIEFVVSNTTEAGIDYSAEDRLTDNPPDSYPGKLTAYLYHRFQYFNGALDKGMVIIPVELIDRNGDNLKRIVFKLADDWNLGSGFKSWLEEANVFLNSLVDRIVTGYPFKEITQIEEELGYQDENLVTGEVFHLWVIEGGGNNLEKRLPFHEADLNVKWVDDMTPYRTRKVRILNGAHTAMVPISFLSGIDLVRDAVNDELLGKFVNEALFTNIIPTIQFAQSELELFAHQVLERFRNPYIDHKCLDISLNSTSKFKNRVLPSLVKYIEDNNKLPEMLVFSLAALITFYKGTEIRNNKLVADRNGEKYFVRDEIDVLRFYVDIWNRYRKEDIKLEELVTEVLRNRDFWGKDLNQISGLGAGVLFYIQRIKEIGVKQSLKELLQFLGYKVE